MPQYATKPQPVKKIIDAKIPNDISAVDLKKLHDQWEAAAQKRAEAIALETKSPTTATLILRYELHKYGRLWQAFTVDKKGKRTPLLYSPSLFFSAVDALEDKAVEDATKS